VEPIWSGYKAYLYDRSLGDWYSITTQWRVVAVNNSDRPLSIVSYQISGSEIGYPKFGKGLYGKAGRVAIFPLDLGPGESITFSLHVGLWIDQKVFELFKKSELLPIEEFREKLVQSYGIDFFGNDMTKRYMYLPGGRAILYPKNGFEDRTIEIQFVTARRNAFIGTGGWYDYEAIKKQDIVEDRDEIFFKLSKLKGRMPNE
jgi:hypothetical protein